MQYQSHQVIPFGDPRVNACLRLTEAYRSLPRPSSPTGTKASTVRPLNLTLLKPFLGSGLSPQTENPV